MQGFLMALSQERRGKKSFKSPIDSSLIPRLNQLRVFSTGLTLYLCDDLLPPAVPQPFLAAGVEWSLYRVCVIEIRW